MATNNSVPKSITRIREEWNGLPVKYVVVVLSFVVITLILLAITLLSDSNQVVLKAAMMAIMFVELAFFYSFLRTPKVMERSVLFGKFLFRTIKGETVYAKFKLPAGFLERIVPIRAFHDGGLIEFVGQKYGCLLKCDPARISEDDLDRHINQVRSLTDSLHGELMLKSYVTSIQQAGRPVEKALRGSLNESGRTKPESNHLYSLHQEATENNNPIIQWRFYIFIGLGKYKSLQDAENGWRKYVPGITQRLNKVGMHVLVIKDKRELGTTYRSLITQVQI